MGMPLRRSSITSCVCIGEGLETCAGIRLGWFWAERVLLGWVAILYHIMIVVGVLPSVLRMALYTRGLASAFASHDEA